MMQLSIFFLILKKIFFLKIIFRHLFYFFRHIENFEIKKINEIIMFLIVLLKVADSTKHGLNIPP